MKKTDILDVVARKLSPFILLFGLYLVTYGHLSPGGGFQGGVALASGIILLLLSRGSSPVKEIFPLSAVNITEASGFLFFLLTGSAGLVTGGGYLSGFLPVGRGGEIPGAGMILLLNTIIGFEVGAGITLICYYLFQGEE